MTPSKWLFWNFFFFFFAFDTVLTTGDFTERLKRLCLRASCFRSRPTPQFHSGHTVHYKRHDLHGKVGSIIDKERQNDSCKINLGRRIFHLVGCEKQNSFYFLGQNLEKAQIAGNYRYSCKHTRTTLQDPLKMRLLIQLKGGDGDFSARKGFKLEMTIPIQWQTFSAILQD